MANSITACVWSLYPSSGRVWYLLGWVQTVVVGVFAATRPLWGGKPQRVFHRQRTGLLCGKPRGQAERCPPYAITRFFQVTSLIVVGSFGVVGGDVLSGLGESTGEVIHELSE